MSHASVKTQDANSPSLWLRYSCAPALLAAGRGVFSVTYSLLQARSSMILRGFDEYAGSALFLVISRGIAVLAERTGRAQQLAKLIDQTCEAALTWNWNGSITFWNRGVERLFLVHESEPPT
jgi:hypothetical protein